MNVLIVPLLVLLVGVVHGQSKFCCFPGQWEGFEGILTGSADDEGNAAMVNSNLNLSVDATGRRVHVDEEVRTGNTITKHTFLQLYNEKIQYIIQNGTCTRAVLGSWNNLNCIPDDATLARTYRLGNKQNLHIKEYVWMIDTLQITLGVTDQCVPVIEKQIGSVSGANILTGLGFQDLRPGISDPSVFVVPDICTKAIEVPMHAVYRRSTLF